MTRKTDIYILLSHPVPTSLIRCLTTQARHSIIPGTLVAYAEWRAMHARREGMRAESRRDQPRVWDGQNENASANVSEGVWERGTSSRSTREYYTLDDVGAPPGNVNVYQKSGRM